MNREQKAAVVEELAGQLKAAEAVYAVDYRGISVSDAAELRGRLREADTVFRIVKNSLTELASDAADTQDLKPLLEGPTALAFVTGDAALAAKALHDAARSMGALEFKGGLMNGSPLTATDIQALARLPAREVLHGQLVGTIAAPLSGLVRTLNALISGLAVQLGQIAEQGLVEGEAPPAEEAEAEAPPAEEAEAEAPPAEEAEAEAPAAEEAEAEAPAEEAAPAEDAEAETPPDEPETATEDAAPEPSDEESKEEA